MSQGRKVGVGKVFVICLREKGDHRRFPATELGMMLGDQISGAVGEVWVAHLLP